MLTRDQVRRFLNGNLHRTYFSKDPRAVKIHKVITTIPSENTQQDENNNEWEYEKGVHIQQHILAMAWPWCVASTSDIFGEPG